MKQLFTDSGPELVELLLAVVASVALAGVGLALELAAVADVLAGQATLGAWELLFGAVLLYAGIYLLGYGRVLPALRASED